MRHTIEGVVQAVCQEMGIAPEALSTPRDRSNTEMHTCKTICSYLFKIHNTGTNRERNKSLGYTCGSDSKTLRRNVSTIKHAILHADEKILQILNNVNTYLNGGISARLYSKEELCGLRIATMSNELHQEEAIKYKDAGIYPFVVRTNNMLLYGYAIDDAGKYIGQSEQEYITAKM